MAFASVLATSLATGVAAGGSALDTSAAAALGIGSPDWAPRSRRAGTRRPR
jgi:hypothetical protein